MGQGPQAVVAFCRVQQLVREGEEQAVAVAVDLNKLQLPLLQLNLHFIEGRHLTILVLQIC